MSEAGVSRFEVLENSADLMAEAVDLFTTVVAKPEYTQVADGHCFRYRDPDERVFVVLRCARIASGIRACLVLLRHGYIQEAGVIIRSLLEFIHDIDFVMDGFLHKEHAEGVKKRMKDFFDSDCRTADELINGTSKSPTMPRKKVYAAVGRLIGASNPFRGRQVSKALEDAYSGYVHGGYPHTMEAYDGHTGQFHTAGVTRGVLKWVRNLALSVHPALNVFAMVAWGLGMSDLAKRLIAQREILEQSEAYRSL